MANPTGKSGPRDKPYRDALRMEIAAAGDNHKLLREIARAHLALAKGGDLQAIKEMADRLDGKPAQEATITHEHQVVQELTDQEIAERIAELRGAGAAEGVVAPPVNPKKFN